MAAAARTVRRAVAVVRTPHHINFAEKYPTWGLAGSADAATAAAAGAFAITLASSEQIVLAKTTVASLSSSVPVSSGFKLACAAAVPHYQGPEHEARAGVLLRYTRSGEPDIGGEHISYVVDAENGVLLGAVRMLSTCDGSDFVAPDTALATTVKFLKQAAPDLVDADVTPEIELPDELPKGQGIDLTDSETASSGLPVGAVAVHWVDDHAEVLGAGETHGMKVKMRFIDDSERYAWVIVDKDSAVHVCERNIFWNFAEFKRETQMWLHDGWVVAHGLELSRAPSVEAGASASALEHVAGGVGAGASATPAD